MDSRRIVGDCREVLKQLIADGVKVQMCVTSPPYFGLRDYGTGTWEGGDGSECEHRTSLRGPGGLAAAAERADGNPRNPENRRDKDGEQYAHYRHTCAKCGARRVDRQIGLEALHDCLGWATGNRCGECHVCVIVDVFRLVREVLADDGTCWVNYGDSYAGSVKGYPSMDVDRASTYMKNYKMGAFPKSYKAPRGLKPKDLVGMPWRIALALQSDGWWLRSDIIWAKANCMPDSVTDRPTRNHEYLFLLAKKPRYFYDSEAIREDGPTYTRKAGGYAGRDGENASRFGGKGGFGDSDVTTTGRNKRTVWNIATEAYSQAHFATFPRKLVEPCILAGTSTYGHCPECLARLVRVVEKWERPPENLYTKRGAPEDGMVYSGVVHDGEWKWQGYSSDKRIKEHPSTTTGWRPTCSHDLEPVPDVVLDCFGGSGTVGLVAEQLGRKYILIELNPEYSKLAREDTKQEVMRL